MSTAGTTAASLAVYGLAHAVIDALCAVTLFTVYHETAQEFLDPAQGFTLYNLLAFGAQPLLGLAVDRSRNPRAAAMLGAGLVAGGTLVASHWPYVAVGAVGVGNAVFHLGAGSISLQLTPGRATAPGIFVAPGALGVLLGTYLGQDGNHIGWPFLLVLGGLVVAFARLPVPKPSLTEVNRRTDWKWGFIVLGLLLACVGGRSLVGFAMDMPWKSVLGLGITMTVAVALGKGLGGVLADRLGWGRIAVGGLALSTPLLAFGANAPAAAIPGLFLFNLTMAVTLAGVANLLPGRPAFAFGLTCLALEVGAWPALQMDALSIHLSEPWMVFGMMLGAAAALYLALQAAFRKLPAAFACVHE